MEVDATDINSCIVHTAHCVRTSMLVFEVEITSETLAHSLLLGS